MIVLYSLCILMTERGLNVASDDGRNSDTIVLTMVPQSNDAYHLFT